MMRDANRSARREHGQASLSVARSRPCGTGRRGFTLTEMLVALVVMVLVMAMVTGVFSITTKTAASSAAIADVEALVRNLADQLQQDLKYCCPERSILVIHGRTQPAALSEEQRVAGQYYRVMTGDPDLAEDFDPKFDSGADPDVNGYSDPRADILMFFTERPTASKAPATYPDDGFQEQLWRGARVAPVQVVYGHAALDTAVESGGTWEFADHPRHIEETDTNGLSELPADRWHLSRRQALLEEPAAGSGYSVSPEFTEIDFDCITRCYSSNDEYAADAVRFSLRRYLEVFAPYTNNSGQLMGRARKSPYLFPDIVADTSLGLAHKPWADAHAEWVLNVLYPYGNEENHHVATVIEQPPAALASNLGVHLVPGCVWFQVEILIPEDPRNGLNHPLSDQRRDTPRWVEVEDGQTYVFVPDTPENRQLVEHQALAAPLAVSTIDERVSTFMQLVPPSGETDIDYGGADTIENRHVRMWPYAIRITARVIDQRGRLEEPIVRSVVHRFE